MRNSSVVFNRAPEPSAARRKAGCDPFSQQGPSDRFPCLHIDTRSIHSGRNHARRRVVKILVCFLCLWFCEFQVPGQEARGQVELSRNETRIDLGLHVSVLRDPAGTMTIEDVVGPSATGRFEPNRTNHVTVPGDPGRTWARFRLRDMAPDVRDNSRWVLEMNCSIADVVELYMPYPDGRAGYRQVKGNRSDRESSDTVVFRNYACRMETQPDRAATYYVRLGSFGPSAVPLVLRTDEAFGTYAMYDYFGFGLIYGLMLAMVLYNLFIFFSLRNRIYLTYVLYMLSFISYFFLFNGHVDAVVDLGGNNSQVLEWVFLGGSIFFSISFCQRFLDTGIHTPRLHRVVVFFKAVALVIILLGFMGRHEAAAILANAAGALGPVNLVILGILRWRQGFGTARYYILANMSFIVGTLVYILWTLGILPVDVPSNMVFTLGPAVEAVLLSFALADRIRALEREKLVLARSQALYKKASETDGLTGLYNKAYLMQRLEAEVGEAGETGQPLSLIIMDVDNFKHYNDTYGHPEGDVVLRALAEVITAEIRDHDAGCRYGGEEFTVIFPNVEATPSLKGRGPDPPGLCGPYLPAGWRGGCFGHGEHRPCPAAFR